MKIIVACQRCGHEREVSRADLIRGDWRHRPCPNCQPRDDDDREIVDDDTREDEAA